MSGFSKVITSGKLGSVEVSEEGGVASLKGTVSAEIGGGNLSGVIKVHNSTQIDMDQDPFREKRSRRIESAHQSRAPRARSQAEWYGCPGCPDCAGCPCGSCR